MVLHKYLNLTIVSVTHLLAKNKCTYDEVDWILEQLQHWIKESREQNEYATCRNYAIKNKTANVNNVVITPMRFVNKNLNLILKDGTPFV